MNGINRWLIGICGHTQFKVCEPVALAGLQSTVHPPGDGDCLPGDVRRVFRAQKCDHTADFLRLPDSGGKRVRSG